MNDDWVGSPDRHDPWASNSNHEPVEGGIERRLCKLEYYQRDIKQELQTKQTIDTAGNMVGTCKACNEPMPGMDAVKLPICDDCLGMLGAITNARKKLVFLG